VGIDRKTWKSVILILGLPYKDYSCFFFIAEMAIYEKTQNYLREFAILYIFAVFFWWTHAKIIT